MNWRTARQQASFRGVPFFVDTDDQPAGHRTQVHEYPGRDLPFVERLGKQTDEIKVSGFVAGDDCLEQRDRLIEAVETPEPGELVHPWRGTLMVSVIKCDYAHSRHEMGVVRFELVFVRDDGALRYPATTRNMASSLNAAADEIKISAIDRFNAAMESIDMTQLRLDAVVQPLGTVIHHVNAVYSNVSDFLGDATTMVNTIMSGPQAFAEGLFALVNEPAQMFGGFYQRAQGLISLFSVSQKSTRVQALEGTIIPSGRTVSTFVTAVKGLAQDVIVADVVRNVAVMPPRVTHQPAPGAVSVETAPRTASFTMDGGADITTSMLGRDDEALPVADDVLDMRTDLDDMLWRIAEQSPPEHFQAVSDARGLVSQHLIRVARQGARLVNVQNRMQQPALVAAYRHYGDATRATEIVARNRIVHPGFLPAKELQLLKD